jgi:hypothetical protein
MQSLKLKEVWHELFKPQPKAWSLELAIENRPVAGVRELHFRLYDSKPGVCPNLDHAKARRCPKLLKA